MQSAWLCLSGSLPSSLATLLLCIPVSWLHWPSFGKLYSPSCFHVTTLHMLLSEYLYSTYFIFLVLPSTTTATATNTLTTITTRIHTQTPHTPLPTQLTFCILINSSQCLPHALKENPKPKPKQNKNPGLTVTKSSSTAKHLSLL